MVGAAAAGRRMIYLDNAATTHPKPECVYAAIELAMRCDAGNPGRSGHRAASAATARVEEARRALARLLGVADPRRIAFASNATEALNTAIHGILGAELAAGRPVHAITTRLEHNSVIRPLAAMEAAGLSVSWLDASAVSGVDPSDVAAALQAHTKLVVVNHVSNVAGTVNDIAAIGALCRGAGVPLLVDAAQSAGALGIDLSVLPVDLMAFPGHKALFGPQGTGGLYVAEHVELAPLKRGGTGSLSELREQPPEMPERLESGTLNVPGLAGLGTGANFVCENWPGAISHHDSMLVNRLLDGLSSVSGVSLYGPPAQAERAGLLSFNIAGMSPQTAAAILDAEYGIAVRAGLHCAPDAHRLLGTFATGGTIRASVSAMTSEADVDALIEAVAELQFTA